MPQIAPLDTAPRRTGSSGLPRPGGHGNDSPLGGSPRSAVTGGTSQVSRAPAATSDCVTCRTPETAMPEATASVPEASTLGGSLAP